jgi:Na+/citrate or Na+/malate symporter
MTPFKTVIVVFVVDYVVVVVAVVVVAIFGAGLRAALQTIRGICGTAVDAGAGGEAMIRQTLNG